MPRKVAETQPCLPNAFALPSSWLCDAGRPTAGREAGHEVRCLPAEQQDSSQLPAKGAPRGGCGRRKRRGRAARSTRRAVCAHVARRGTRAATACEQPHVAATARIARSCCENTPQRGAATLSGGRGRVHRRAEPGRRCSRATAASEQSDVAAAARNARGRQDRAHLLRCESTLQGWAAAQGCGRGPFRTEPLQLAGCQRDACSGSSSVFGPSPARTSRGRHWERCNTAAEA